MPKFQGFLRLLERCLGFFSPGTLFIHHIFLFHNRRCWCSFNPHAAGCSHFYRQSGLHLYFPGNGNTNYFIIHLGNVISGSVWQVQVSDQALGVRSRSAGDGSSFGIKKKKKKTFLNYLFMWLYNAFVSIKCKTLRFYPGCIYSHGCTRSWPKKRDAAGRLFYSVFIIKYKMGTYYINT